MGNKNEAQIRELHERLMNAFMKQIGESISEIHVSIGESKPELQKSDYGPATGIKDFPAPPQEEHGGPEKINEIRSEVAATQSAQILSPDKQSELMEIVKQKSQAFERKLRRIAAGDNSAIELASQKFKDELMDIVRKQLTEKKYALVD